MMAGRKDDVVALDFGLVDGEVDGINGVRWSNESDERWERKATACGLDVTDGDVEDGERWRTTWRDWSVVGARCCRIGGEDGAKFTISVALDDKRFLDLFVFRLLVEFWCVESDLSKEK